MEREIKKEKIEEKLTDDRLSALSDCLLYHILSLLDMKQVVCMGILSRRWKDLPTSVSDLNFFHQSYNDKNNFVRFVDQALLNHSAPNIQKFRVCFLYDEKYISHVDVWIYNAMIKGVQELDLNFPYWRNNSSYQLPFWLFEYCITLISLKLRNCKLGVSSFACFTKLTALSLDSCFIRDGLIEDLLKGCPLLEDLRIKYNFFSCHSIKICSSSSGLHLKHLRIEVDSMLHLDIDAPNLQVLKLYARKVCMCSLKEMPVLREAYMDVSNHHGGSISSECISSLDSSIQNLRHAKALTLSSACLQCMKVMPIPTFKDPQSYFKTKCLTLMIGVRKFEMPGIANLLWSSPDLENLIIDLVTSTFIYHEECKEKYDFDEREYWESLTVAFPCLVHHLKTIKITCVGYLDRPDSIISEFIKMERIDLVKFLLKNARVLECLRIHIPNESKSTIHNPSRSKRLTQKQWQVIVSKLTLVFQSFPRAASPAKFTIL